MTLYPKKMEPLANDSFEARIVRALEAERETVRVPEEFAARVVSALPAVKPARRRSHVGRALVVVFAVMLMAVMIWAAPGSVNVGLRNFAFDAEMGACAVLAGMAVVMARVWDRV